MSEQPNISSNFGNVSVNNSNLIVSSSSAIFDVGENFTVNSLGSNVLVVNGNISCSTLHYDSLDPPISGGGGGSSNLEDVSNNGNVTSNTIQFLNPVTSLTASGNVSVDGNVTASKFYGDGGLLSNLATVAKTGAYSDLSGKPTSITDLDVADGTNGQFLTTDGAGTFTFATVSGGGGGSSNLQQVTDLGNVTSNTVIFNGGLVTGNTATVLTATSNTLTIDMEGLSYKTFTCSTSNSISNISVSNDILGSQGMIFLTATGNITVNGYTSNLDGANTIVSYDDITMVNGDKAMIGILSDGTSRYINAAQFPSAGGTVVESSSGGGSTQECLDVHPTSSQNVTSLTRIIFNTERYNSNTSVFSLNTSTGQVTVNKTGLFMINYTASTGISSGSARSVSKADLYINDSIESYTSVYMYNRLNGNEENTGSQTIIKQLTSGDTVDVRVQRHSGSDTIISVQGGTGLRILEILS